MTEVVSIASEKVTETLSVTETPLWLSVGYVEETVGAVVSLVLVLDLLPLQEMTVKLKRKRERRMSRCFTWFPNCLVLGKPKLYHDSGVFYKNMGRLWSCV